MTPKKRSTKKARRPAKTWADVSSKTHGGFIPVMVSNSEIDRCGIPLSTEQRQAVHACLASPSHLLLTGGAGSGKSQVLKALRRITRVTTSATTGMAAIQVSGITCDRLFCFSRDTYKILDESTLHRNMTEAGPIIAIDEASMVDAHMARLFGMITMRYRKKLLLIGDFAQAAPVNGDWAVSTKLFTDAHRIHLTEVHRQADPEFVAALQCMRHGVVNDTVWNALRSCRVQNPPMDDTWVRMFATNDMADRLNQERLHAITSAHEQQVLISRCEPMSARFEDPVIQQKACMDSQFAHGMTLAPRARVLVTINDYESQAVNGDAGTVIRIDASPKGETMGVLVDLDRKGRTYFEPRERYILSGAGNRLAKISGIPLRLGWALTIHRSQGLTLDKAYADLSSIYRFPEDRRHGMAYVACSRARSRDGLQIKGLSPQVVQCDPAIKAWI